MKKAAYTLSAILTLTAPMQALAQAVPATPQRPGDHTEKLAENVYLVNVGGLNIPTLVGDNGILIVNDQTEEQAANARAAIAKLSGKPVRYVINANWHSDKVGGNETFAKAGAVVVAQNNTRMRMMSDQPFPISDRIMKAAPPTALPALTFDSGLSFYFDGEEVDLVHVPNAHSDADVVTRFRNANVIHTGDIFNGNGLAIIDVAGGGTINGTIAAFDVVLGLADDRTWIVPSHGPVVRKAALQAYRKLLVTVRDRVAELIKNGATKDAVVDANPMKGLVEDRKGTTLTPAVLIQEIYTDLKRR